MDEAALFPDRAATGAAVSLTYDGGDLSHIEVAVPTLDEHALQGVFFLPSEVLVAEVAAWLAVRNHGHEIGAHPFYRVSDGRGNLPNWTLDMVEDELRSSRRLLTELFPEQPDFPFAYPGFETMTLHAPYDRTPISYRETVRRVFEVGRSEVGGFNGPHHTDFAWLCSTPAPRFSGRELIALAEQAVERQAWLILRFAGIGVGSEGTDARAHAEFCAWLAQHRADLPTVSMARHSARLRSLRESGFQTFTLNLE